jgi:hypothetical protein
MAAVKTHFEQIPVKKVKLIAKELPAEKQGGSAATAHKTSTKRPPSAVPPLRRERN